jgi:hypothetical protein
MRTLKTRSSNYKVTSAERTIFGKSPSLRNTPPRGYYQHLKLLQMYLYSREPFCCSDSCFNLRSSVSHPFWSWSALINEFLMTVFMLIDNVLHTLFKLQVSLSISQYNMINDPSGAGCLFPAIQLDGSVGGTHKYRKHTPHTHQGSQKAESASYRSSRVPKRRTLSC